MGEEEVLCTACQRFSRSHQGEAAKKRPDFGELLDRLNHKISGMEARCDLDNRLRWLWNRPPPLGRAQRVAAAGLAVAFSLAPFAAWMTYGGLQLATMFLGTLLVAIALLAGPRLIREPHQIRESPPGSAVIRWLGMETDLFIVQSFSAIAFVISALDKRIEEASLFAWVLIAFSLFIGGRVGFKSRILGVLGGVYLVYLAIVRDMSYEIEARAYSLGRGDPLWFFPSEIWWMLAFIAIFPQISLIRWGNTGIGNFVGDFRVRLFGREVLLGFGSVVLLFSAWQVIQLFWSIPFFLSAIA